MTASLLVLASEGPGLAYEVLGGALLFGAAAVWVLTKLFDD